MSQYPWNKKNNTFTWLSSLYNPFNPLLQDLFAIFNENLLQQIVTLVLFSIIQDSLDYI